MRSYFYILSSLVVWSTWGLAVRWLGKPATVITFYNSLFALVFQAAGLAWASRRGGLHLGRDLGAALFLGLCGLVNVLSFFYALNTTTIASALLTHYTAPVFVAVIAPFILKDRMKGTTVAALAVSVAGLLLIFSRGLEMSGEAGLLGAAAGTLSGLAYAFTIIFSRHLSPRNHPLKLALTQSVVTVVALALFVLPSGEAAISVPQGLVLALVALVHSTVALGMYIHGIRHVTAQEAGVLGYIEPISGIFLAYVFLGEVPALAAVTGGVFIILSGVILVVSGCKSAGGVVDNRG